MILSVLIKHSKEFGINKIFKFNANRIRLLELFLEHVGQVYSRAQLLDHINPDSFDGRPCY
jgi:DNA-binding response OmpR family regulator